MMKRKMIMLIIFMMSTFYVFGAINLSKQVSVTTYVPGEVITYKIKVENDEASPQGRLTITDDMGLLPLENLTLISADASGTGNSGTVTVTGKKFEAVGVSIEGNGYVEYTFETTVSSGASGDIVNTAIVLGPGLSASDSATVSELDKAGAVSISNTSNVSEYDNGDDITYIIKVKNSSENKLKEINIMDDFSGLGMNQLEIISIQTTGEGTDPVISEGFLSGGKLNAQNTVIGPKGSITYTVKGTVDPGKKDDIVNIATVAVDGTEKSDTDTLSRTIYDYNVEKSIEGGKTTYSPGKNITYLLKLKNNKSNTVKGLDISDLLSMITADTVTGTGVAFDSGSIEVSATTTGTGSSSGLASNPLSGDLVATDVVIGPGGSIVYRVTAKVNNNVTGDISNIATVKETTRDDNEKKSNEVIVIPGMAVINIEKSADVTADYLPGDTIKYTIVISNNGEGFGERYSVTDSLAGIVADLANDSTQATSSVDISGSPFDSGSIKLISMGANSTSKNYVLNNAVNSLELSDEVYVAPGESITYEITGVTNPSAIGEIDNTASVLSSSGTGKTAREKTTPKELNTSNIEVTKKTNTKEYEPGTAVVYEITVKNNSSGKFVNNFNLIDKINSITAEQVDGSMGKAFSSWTLNVIKPTNSKNGTKPGTSISGTSTTTDINLNVDIAPGEVVRYELVAIIGTETVGRIVDGSVGGDNVQETGDGIIMSTSKLDIAKLVNDTEYSPNEVIEYKIIIANAGEGYAVNVPVVDKLSTITSITGAKAYSGWEITSKLEPVPGSSLLPTGDSGIASEPLIDTDLNVLANIGPETRLTYVIRATMDGKATGWVQNEASADGNLVADKGIFPVKPEIKAEKTAAPQWYSDENPLEIVYKLKVTNESDAGYAKGVKVEDDLKSIGVELLNGSTLSEVFESYSVTTELNGSGTESTTNGKIVDGVLMDTVNITAGGSVVYTITVKAKKDLTADIIPYKTITNTAEITPVDINGNSDTSFDVSATTRPKEPRLSIVKSTTNTNFIPGSTVVYRIKVENNGEGYANNARVTDILAGAFSSWTIDTYTDTPYRGSKADINGTLQPNKNIDVIADIAPHGFVEYIVTAVVDGRFTGTVINNTAKVEDTQSGNDYESSADLTGNNEGDLDKGLYITKRVNRFDHTPGSPLTYTIDIYNTTSAPIDFSSENYRVIDKFSEITTGLANDGSNPPTDIRGFPFKNIRWSGSDGRSGSITEGSDFIDQPTIPAASGSSPGKYTYNIALDVKDNVLEGKIQNVVYLTEANGSEISRASVETNREGDFGGLTRSVNRERYRPGDELIYRIKARGGSDGYANNLQIDEAINSISTLLIDGTRGNPYYNPDTRKNEFTVDVYVNGVLNGTPVSSGTSKPGVPADNSDISEVLDLAPGEDIEYVVKGIIRPDADGVIAYKGLETDPYRHNLIVTKRTSETAYEPGKEVTFMIEIRNSSDGNARDIDIKDEISKLTVKLSDETTAHPFNPKEWKITSRIEQIGAEDYRSYADPGSYSDNTDIDTKFDLPIDTELIYEIKGIINPLAVGDISNTAFIEGDQITGEVGSARADVDGDKSVVAYYDRNGTTTLTGGYKPGGWIEYLIFIDNTTGKGIQDNVPVEDLISEVTTEYIDGSTGPAFSTWEISLDSSTTNEAATVPGLGIWDSNPGLILKDKDLIEGNTNNPNPNPDLGNSKIPMLIDVAPGGRVAFRVKAKVDERAVGFIENTASSGRKDFSSGRSQMLSPNVSIKKTAYEADGSGSITSTEKKTYKPGDTFYYIVNLENKGKGNSVGKIEDLLRDIKAEIPESSGGGANPKENPFTEWEVSAVKNNSEIPMGSAGGPDYNNGEDNVTDLDDFETSNPQNNNDINSDEIYIAPGGALRYTIKATIKDNILTRIRNTSKYTDQTGSKSNKADLNPLPPEIEVEKTVKYIGDDPTGFTNPQTNYSPEDYVVYEMEVKNTGESFGNNIVIKDLVSSVIAEVSGGGTQQAFDSWEITDDGGSNPDTYVPDYVSTDNLNLEVDIAQGDTIKFTVKAQIKDNLVGTIPGNVITASDGDSELDRDTSQVIDPKLPEITYYKTFGDIGGTEMSDFEYIPFGNIHYKVVIKNNGEGYGNNIEVKDLLSNVVDGKGEGAFSSSSILKIIITDKNGKETPGTTDGKTVIKSGSVPLDADVDIEPGARVDFYLEGVVEGTATGDITNRVNVSEGSIESGKTDEVTATLTTAQVVGIKTATPEYIPGGEIEYNLEIKNNSDSTADNVEITDLIKEILVETADGTEKQAFKPGWAITAVVEEDEGNSDISDLTAQIATPGEAIKDALVILGSRDNSKPYSVLKINIKGNVIDDAVGVIKNTLTYSYDKKTRSVSAFTTPKKGSVKIEKTAVTSRTDESEDNSYIPGNEKTFLVEVTNEGAGYALDVEIEDKITNLLTKAAGSFAVLGGHTLDAFTFTDVADVEYTAVDSGGNVSTLTKVLESDESRGFKGTVNIAPGDTFKIWISGNITTEAIEDIKNTATAKYDGSEIKDDAIITSVDSKLQVKKEISTDGVSYSDGPVTYKSGDTIYYRVSIENSGAGWGDDLLIQDKISDIKAEQSGTGTGNAFDTSSIDISYTGIDSKYLLVNSGSKNLESVLDIPPGATLNFDMSGRVNNNITGQIDNTASFASISGDLAKDDTNTVIVKPEDAAITLTKEVVGGATDYSIGEQIHYRITVENTSESFANDLRVIDNVRDILVESAIDTSPVNAFTSFNTAPPVCNLPSKIVSADYSKGLDVIVDLAPKDSIVFDVYGTVTATAVGDIINVADYEYKGVTTPGVPVILKPKKANLVIDKMSLTPVVIPGEDVIFRVKVENTGEGIANDVTITDDMNLIMAELSDGTIDKAIVENSVSAAVIEAIKTAPTMPSVDVTDNHVTTTLDIAPRGRVVLEIKGKLKDDIVGSITNTGEYEFINNGDTDATTGSADVTIGAGNADVSIEKEAIVDPEIGGYIPGDDVEFRIKVHNEGPGIANNINVYDDIKGIMVETATGDKAAFSTWIVELVDESSISLPTLVPGIFPLKDSNLDLNVDIAPGDTIEFKVTGKVIEEAFGDITNTAKASYEDNLHNDGSDAPPVSDEASFIPSRSDVKIEKTEDKVMYAPGEEITYTITLTGLGPGIAKEVKFIDNIKGIQTETTSGLGDAFDTGSVQIISSELTGGATEVKGVSLVDGLVSAELNIPRGGKAVYTIKATTATNAVGKVVNTAKFSYVDNDGSDKYGEATTNSDPMNAKLTISKSVYEEEYIAGEAITYTVKISNTGEGIANDVSVEDKIMDIVVPSIDGPNILAFESVNITDNKSSLSGVSNISDYEPDANLKAEVDIAPGDTVEFVLTGVTAREAGDDITNKAEYSFKNNDGTLGYGKAEVTSKVKLNEGELVLTKESLQKEVEKGGVVEYEIIVRNTTQTYFVNVGVEDRTPAGFDYIDDTTEMTLSGPDGEFGTDDDEDVSDEPVKGSTLSFTAVNIGPKESLRIRYLLRASIGTTFGKYTNTAYAVSGGREVSNRDSATVEIIPDELFDTATIIGKVYEDLNGDGYQGDATAKKIKVTGGVKNENYIPDSTTLQIGSEVEKVPDSSVPLEKGITIGRLRGLSRNRKLREGNKAVIRYETTNTEWEPITITSKGGTNLYIDGNGKITVNHKGDVDEGLSAEKLKVTRNVYKQKGRTTYLQEIVIENLGIYEDGIPGVKLITVDGIVVETDEFGRYHVPDEWVLKKTGKNFIIKVDEDSLPQGMRVLSENPRVRRITPNGLNKFNFSIQREEDDFEIGDAKGVVEVRGEDNE